MRMAELIALPTVIEEPGKYHTRCGEVVTVKSISKGWATGNYENGIEEKWDVSGRLLPVSESDNDIVPCQWGTLERSRLAGTVHRKCQVPNCKAINALDDDNDEE